MAGTLTPMRGTAVTNARLNLRRGAPDIAAPIAIRVEPGTTLAVTGVVDGSMVSGNAQWYAGEEDTYYWTGGCGAFHPDGVAAGGVVMNVHRRTNGTIQVLGDAEIKSIFGNPTFTESSPKGAVTLAPGWEAANIVTLPTPILASTGHAQIRVHAKARAHFERVLAAIDAAGLADVIRTCAGTFVPRHKGWDPARGLSSHTWGIAIDINVAWNGYGAVPAPLGVLGSVRELVPVFEAHGFAWGGYFAPQKYCDGMHFELARLDA